MTVDMNGLGPTLIPMVVSITLTTLTVKTFEVNVPLVEFVLRALFLCYVLSLVCGVFWGGKGRVFFSAFASFF